MLLGLWGVCGFCGLLWRFWRPPPLKGVCLGIPRQLWEDANYMVGRDKKDIQRV